MIYRAEGRDGTEILFGCRGYVQQVLYKLMHMLDQASTLHTLNQGLDTLPSNVATATVAQTTVLGHLVVADNEPVRLCRCIFNDGVMSRHLPEMLLCETHDS